MFYLETFNEDGSFNNIEVQRLKDKLGTRQLPTAELLLDGTHAKKVSDDIMIITLTVRGSTLESDVSIPAL